MRYIIIVINRKKKKPASFIQVGARRNGVEHGSKGPKAPIVVRLIRKQYLRDVERLHELLGERRGIQESGTL